MARRAATPESVVVKACLTLLGLRRIYAWRSNNTPVYDRLRRRYRTFRGLYGVSDILGCLDDGRLLAVECKAEGGQLTAAQRDFLDEVRERGGVAFVVRSAGELDEALRREGIV